MRHSYFAQWTEKGKHLSKSLAEEVDKLDDHGCPKIEELVKHMKKGGFVPATHSDTRLHKTVQSEQQNCLSLENSALEVANFVH